MALLIEPRQSVLFTSPEIDCRGEGLPEWGLASRGSSSKGRRGQGLARLEPGCAGSSREHGAALGPVPSPSQGSGSQQAPAFHRHSENMFLLPGITQRFLRVTQADPRKRITGLLTDWDCGEDVWRNLLSLPSGREARGPQWVPSHTQSCG